MRSLSGPKRRRIEPQSALFTREKAAKGALGASVYAYERRWDKTYQRGYEGLRAASAGDRSLRFSVQRPFLREGEALADLFGTGESDECGGYTRNAQNVANRSFSEREVAADGLIDLRSTLRVAVE